MTTKKAQIMALHAQGKTIREIACALYDFPLDAPRDAIDHKMAYVRVALRQRGLRGRSVHDDKWTARQWEKPEFRAKQFAKWRAHGLKWRTTERGREWMRDYMREWRRKRLEATDANHVT